MTEGNDFFFNALVSLQIVTLLGKISASHQYSKVTPIDLSDKIKTGVIFQSKRMINLNFLARRKLSDYSSTFHIYELLRSKRMKREVLSFHQAATA